MRKVSEKGKREFLPDLAKKSKKVRTLFKEGIETVKKSIEESIPPESKEDLKAIFDIIETKIYLIGGAYRSVILEGTNPKDLDVAFKDQQSADLFRHLSLKHGLGFITKNGNVVFLLAPVPLSFNICLVGNPEYLCNKMDFNFNSGFFDPLTTKEDLPNILKFKGSIANVKNSATLNITTLGCFLRRYERFSDADLIKIEGIKHGILNYSAILEEYSNTFKVKIALSGLRWLLGRKGDFSEEDFFRKTTKTKKPISWVTSISPLSDTSSYYMQSLEQGYTQFAFPTVVRQRLGNVSHVTSNTTDAVVSPLMDTPASIASTD